MYCLKYTCFRFLSQNMNDRNYNRSLSIFLRTYFNWSCNSNNEKFDHFNSKQNLKIILITIILVVIEIRIGFDYHPWLKVWLIWINYWNKIISLKCKHISASLEGEGLLLLRCTMCTWVLGRCGSGFSSVSLSQITTIFF